MTTSLKRFCAFGGFASCRGLALADEPKKVEPLPPPRQLGPSKASHAAVDDQVPMYPADPYGHLPYVRRSQYAVWQNWAVDREGFFKPLVIYSPYGAYYAGNGKPFPWAATLQYEWMPKVVDAVPFRPAIPTVPPPPPPFTLFPVLALRTQSRHAAQRSKRREFFATPLARLASLLRAPGSVR